MVKKSNELFYYVITIFGHIIPPLLHNLNIYKIYL